MKNKYFFTCIFHFRPNLIMLCYLMPKQPFELSDVVLQLNEMIQSPVEGQFWQVDHINPVYRGGGQCSLENLQTLCTVCHRMVQYLIHTNTYTLIFIYSIKKKFFLKI